jgi:hypothetical protein
VADQVRQDPDTDVYAEYLWVRLEQLDPVTAGGRLIATPLVPVFP